MKFSSQKLNNSGQHALEYLLLISLVIAGIIIMQPYVIRGWNAYIKSEETSIRDSYEDPGIPGVLDLPPYCACSHILPCSTPPCCGYGTCARTMAAQVWTCNPLGCQAGADQCTPDSLCCDDPVFPSLLQCGAAGGCPAGEAPGTQICGTNPPVTRCFYNPLCVFQCQGTLLESHKIMPCNGDYTGLTNPTFYRYIPPGGCTIGTQCEVQCRAPFVPNVGNTSCRCPANSIETACLDFFCGAVLCSAGATCVCPPNNVTFNCTPTTLSCGDGYCRSGETCGTCPSDCGACFCGNRACETNENCVNCEADCGGCPVVCGDGTCGGLEVCNTCLADCGTCVCGDGICSPSGENSTTCPVDCP